WRISRCRHQFLPGSSAQSRLALLKKHPAPLLSPVTAYPKLVSLKGLREVRRVVVYHHNNSKPPGSPHGYFSTFAMPPIRCASDNSPSMQPYCCGSDGHDGTRDDVGHLPLGGPRRQLSDRAALFLPGTPVGHAVLGVLSSAYLPC